MSKEKVRKHRLSTNKPIIYVLIITLIMMFAYFTMAQIIIGVGISFPFVLIITGDVLANQDMVTDIATIISVIGGFVVLFFYYFWYKPEYKWKYFKKEAWKLAAPILIYWFIFFGIVYTISAGHCSFGIPTFSAAIPMVSAGINEEVAFREVGISYMRRQRKGEKMILPTLLFTSISFGITHILNAIRGNILQSLVQSLLAVTLGVFFGAIFIRTGNIWPCIVAHGLHDLFVTCFSVNYDVTDEPIHVRIVGFGCEVLLMIFGLYLVRKEKRPEIEAMWNEKWQLPVLSGADNGIAE